MRVLVVSSSDFGYKCLENILHISEIEIVGILTTKENSITVRKRKTQNIHGVLFDTVAEENGIPLFKLSGKIKEEECVKWINQRKADLGLVIGWYQKIPQEILCIPARGMVGIHASMLPLYRGGAPLVWAMINGEKETGVTLFYLSEQMDEGDILAQERFEIKTDDYIADVYRRMETCSMKMLSRALRLMTRGEIIAQKQKELPEDAVSSWPMRTPDDGLINWWQPANKIYDFIRAQSKPYPGAFTILDGHRIYIWKSHVEKDNFTQKKPGTIISIQEQEGKKQLLIAAGLETVLGLEEISVLDDKIDGPIIQKIKEGVVFEEG